MVRRRWALEILRLVAALAALAAPAAAQPTAPYPVANLNMSRDTLADGGFASGFGSLGERTLFISDDGLWSTDGTRAGTRLLLDLCPGDCWTGVEVLQVTPGLVYFDLDRIHPPVIHNSGLWRSDGTDGGTYRLTADKVFPVGYAAATGRFLFRPSVGVAEELWSTDGTLEGTVRIEGVEPRRPITAPGTAAVGGVVVFSADTAGSGVELWVSDGTAEGTHLLADLDSSSSSGSRPESFLEAGDFALFVTPSSGDLWATDGTAAGTRRLADGLVGGSNSIVEVASAGGRAWFTVEVPSRVELWTTDGTKAGTRRISPPGLDARRIGLLGDRVLFAGFSGLLGREPWVGDGTPGSSLPLADLCPGACGSEPVFLGVAGGRLVFFANDGVHGRELWSTDGTVAGTRLLADLCPGSCDSTRSFGSSAIAVGPRLFVRGVESVVATDGTPAGTVVLAGSGGLTLVDFGAAGERALFPARDAIGDPWRLLASDGTRAGTRPLTDLPGARRLLRPHRTGRARWGGAVQRRHRCRRHARGPVRERRNPGHDPPGGAAARGTPRHARPARRRPRLLPRRAIRHR